MTQQPYVIRIPVYGGNGTNVRVFPVTFNGAGKGEVKLLNIVYVEIASDDFFTRVLSIYFEVL